MNVPVAAKGHGRTYWIETGKILLLVAATAAILGLCVLVGPGIPGSDVMSLGVSSGAIMRLRMVGVGSAAIVGAALALAGVLLQGLLRNPLADPYILGISSGAAAGVMVWIVFSDAIAAVLLRHPWWGWLLAHGQTIPALAGALLTCVVVFLLGRKRGGLLDPITLLLSGVVLSSVNGALIMFLNNLVPYGAKSDILDYLFGYISEGTAPLTVGIALSAVLLGWIGALSIGPAMNIGSLSDVEAESLGVRLQRLRITAFVLAGLLTAASIALAGPIGFVGLICPHICRGLFGPDHRRLLVVSPLVGAAFLMLADTFVRCTGAWFNGELPVGVITALCGGPFFLYLLTRRRTWS
jgi:iron complex transport system permease protein